MLERALLQRDTIRTAVLAVVLEKAEVTRDLIVRKGFIKRAILQQVVRQRALGKVESITAGLLAKTKHRKPISLPH